MYTTYSPLLHTCLPCQQLRLRSCRTNITKTIPDNYPTSLYPSKKSKTFISPFINNCICLPFSLTITFGLTDSLPAERLNEISTIPPSTAPVKSQTNRLKERYCVCLITSTDTPPTAPSFPRIHAASATAAFILLPTRDVNSLTFTACGCKTRCLRVWPRLSSRWMQGKCTKSTPGMWRASSECGLVSDVRCTRETVADLISPSFFEMCRINRRREATRKPKLAFMESRDILLRSSTTIRHHPFH